MDTMTGDPGSEPRWPAAVNDSRISIFECQAIQKRGLSRALLTDNGGPITAAETREGLVRLGISPATTLPYAAYQNAKQEIFWAQIEGRLLAMLEGGPPISGSSSSMKP